MLNVLPEPAATIVALAAFTGVRKSELGKPINLDALAADVIVTLVTKAGVRWHGWHAFRRITDESSSAQSCR
jgi:hypothetical protein